MSIQSNNMAEKFGLVIGFLFIYFVFTTVLYFILSILERLPANWNYFYVMVLTAIIVFIGFAVRKYIK